MQPVQLWQRTPELSLLAEDLIIYARLDCHFAACSWSHGEHRVGDDRKPCRNLRPILKHAVRPREVSSSRDESGMGRLTISAISAVVTVNTCSKDDQPVCELPQRQSSWERHILTISTQNAILASFTADTSEVSDQSSALSFLSENRREKERNRI